MNRNPKMRKMPEVEAALRHAEKRQAAEEAEFLRWPRDSMKLEHSRHLISFWSGQCAAYRFVLREAPDQDVTAHAEATNT